MATSKKASPPQRAKKARDAAGDHPARSDQRRADLIAAVAELAPEVGIAAAWRLLAVPHSSS